MPTSVRPNRAARVTCGTRNKARLQQARLDKGSSDASDDDGDASNECTELNKEIEGLGRILTGTYAMMSQDVSSQFYLSTHSHNVKVESDLCIHTGL